MAKSIVIAGKGGTGKSTIAALLILHLSELNMGPVLAIDADPDANLGTLLGLEPKQTVGDLREEVLMEFKNLPHGMSRANYVEAGLHHIIEEEKNFDLITMGRGEGPGCYCYLNNIIRKFSDDLMPSYSWAVIDNEAGLEHISRRISSNIDALIVVVDEDPNSFKTAIRIGEITDDLKNEVNKRLLITNKIKKGNKNKIKGQVSKLPMEYICDIPFNAKLKEINFNGESLKNFNEFSVKEKIGLIIKKIGEKNGSS